jgi:DNA-binding FadR family transcriptional regulator
LLKPIRRQRLREAVEAHLEELILTGAFQPGKTLPSEHEIAAQMEVSRTVVRDAVRALAAKGLLEIRHGVGAFVTQSGRERLAEALALSLRRGDYSPWELYIVRRSLELAVIELAIEEATPPQIAEMRATLECYRQHYKSVAAASGVDPHTLFHQLMVRCTGNRILVDLLDPITVFRVPQTRDSEGAAPSETDFEAYIKDHEAIVDAIERRDREAARFAMIRHLEPVRQRAHPSAGALRPVGRE